MIDIQPNKARPYLLNVRFPYDPALVALVKSVPGATWIPAGKLWSIPAEFCDAFCKQANIPNPIPKSSNVVSLPTQFKSGYQHEAAVRARYADTGFIFNFSPGLGKTAAVIETLRISNTTQALIIAPAMVRKTWQNEFKKWWPEASEHFYLISEGKRKTPSKAARIAQAKLCGLFGEGVSGISSAFVATSYGLLPSLQEILPVEFAPQAIILDEIHCLQDPKTKQFKEVQELISRYPEAKRYGLTGTLFTNGIINAWGPLSTIFPGRYGSRHNFGVRYCQSNHNGFGWEYPGVDAEHLPELQWRLSLVSKRATELDAVGKMPVLSVDEIEEDDSWDLAEWVKQMLAAGDSRIAILTYNVDKAKLLGYELQKIAPTITLTGEVSSEDRTQALDDLSAHKGNAIVVATISSIKIGINGFANFPLVLFTDLSDNLEEVTQAVLRFRRKGSTLDRVRGFMLTNAVTRPKAMRLKRKIDAIASVIALGGAEATMQAAFKEQNTFTAQEWQDAINDILGSKTDDDGGIE